MHKQLSYISFAVFILFCNTAGAQSDNVSVYDSVIFSQDDKVKLNEASFSPAREVQIIEEKKVPEKKLDSLKKEEAYWYANFEQARKKEVQSGGSIIYKGWFNSLLWIVIVITFIAVVIFYLASSNLQLFRKASEKIFGEDEGEITEDIFVLNYDKEIGKALEAANYRLAVRLWYLRTLKELSQRNIIHYSHEKTNSDYLSALRGSTYYHDFFRLTRNFEYTWYGGFRLSKEAYMALQKDFTGFKSSLPS